jgi:hypothetical protein
MILTAAVACGLALSQSMALFLWQMLRPIIFHPEHGGPRRMGDPSVVEINGQGFEIGGLALVLLAIGVLGQFFLPWLAAFIVIRLRRPRPALREAVRQPGTAAVLILCGWFVLSLTPLGTAGGMALGRVFQLLLLASVPTAWIALSWTGYRCSESGWIDRLGCGLGIFYCLAVAGLLVAMTLP